MVGLSFWRCALWVTWRILRKTRTEPQQMALKLAMGWKMVKMVCTQGIKGEFRAYWRFQKKRPFIGFYILAPFFKSR